MFFPQTNVFLSLYFRKNVTRLSFCLKRIGQVFPVSPVNLPIGGLRQIAASCAMCVIHLDFSALYGINKELIRVNFTYS